MEHLRCERLHRARELLALVHSLGSTQTTVCTMPRLDLAMID
jgi:hypothetical protein